MYLTLSRTQDDTYRDRLFTTGFRQAAYAQASYFTEQAEQKRQAEAASVERCVAATAYIRRVARVR